MTGTVIAIITGAIIASYLTQATVGYWAGTLVLVCAFIAWRCRGCLARLLFGFACGMLWLSVYAQQYQSQRLTERSQALVQVQVIDLPKFNQPGPVIFLAKILQANAAGASRVQLSWLDPPNRIQPGQRWRVQVRFRPIVGVLNPVGFDAERWAFLNRIHGRGWVVSGELVEPGGGLDSRRMVISDWLRTHAETTGGLLAALAVGDRRRLQRADWDVLQATGTSHLMAISGLHIGIIAAFGLLLGKRISIHLSARIPTIDRWRLDLVIGVAMAAGYALLAGFSLPTQRALTMVSVGAGTSSLLRFAQPVRSLALAAIGVIVLDPAAPLRNGFWLSFGAVAVLLVGLVGRQGDNTWQQKLLAWLRVQWVVTVGLIPLLVLAVLPTSGLSPLVNLVAIPWVAIAVLPALLVSVALAQVNEPLALASLQMADWAAAVLWLGLQKAAQLNWLWQPARADIGLVVVAVAAAGYLLTPIAAVRRLGLVLLAVAIWPATPKWPAGRLVLIHVLDVGQGQAVLLESERGMLLYDSGPASRFGWTAAESIIGPFSDYLGRSPGQIVISHRDSDHAGGMGYLRQRWPQAEWRLPNAERAAERCTTGEQWTLGEMHIKVLHPNAELPYLGNDSSCVLSIDIAGHRLLLMGDVSKVIEQRLLRAGVQHHDWLLVPHHGSQTSSSLALIKRLRPDWAVVSVGADNRFGMPHPEVKQRYHGQQVPLLSTSELGYLRFAVTAEQISLEVAQRRDRQRIWHRPTLPGKVGNTVQ